MVNAQELRDRIDKLAQKAEELLQQGNRDDARTYQEQVRILQKQLDDLTGGDGLLQLDVPCCLGILFAPQPRALGEWLWVGEDPPW